MSKSMLRVALRATVCFSVLGAPSALAQSTTYVVDAAGGPGSNFTDLPPAVAAAQSGDVIAVRAGNYSSFTLGQGVTIVGESGVVVGAGTQIIGVPANQRAVLCSLTMGALKVSACAGNVTIDEGWFKGPTTWNGLVTVENSTDVRLHRTRVFATTLAVPNSLSAALTVDASRVELSSCDVRGGKGLDWSGSFLPTSGGTAIICSLGSRLHVALTNVTGGKGGKGNNSFGQPGANGGTGMRMISACEVIVAGTPNQVVRGGDMGAPYGIGTQHPGVGVEVAPGASLRYSGTIIASGGPGTWQAILNYGTALQAIPDDPTLEMVGNPSVGASVQLVIHGVAGVKARLQQGNQPLVVDDGQTEIERLDNRIRLHPLGPIPAAGSVAYTINVPANWPLGRLRVFQGQEVDPATSALLERTNSAFLIPH